MLSKLYQEYLALHPSRSLFVEEAAGAQGDGPTIPGTDWSTAELAKPLEATRPQAHSLDAARPVNRFMAPTFKAHSSEVYYIIENKDSFFHMFPTQGVLLKRNKSPGQSVTLMQRTGDAALLFCRPQGKAG